jgi:pSer/pThr/pTyr-binding forkhead associated (FHA) protein
MADQQNQPPKSKRQTILPERIMRRMLEGVGDVVDRKLGRAAESPTGLTTDQIVVRMNQAIDARVRDEKGKGRIAPHHLKLKIEWGTHSETPEEVTKRLETELLAAAIDHINDNRYRTLAPVKIESEVDIFTKGIAIEPTFGEFEADLQRQDMERKLGKPVKPHGEKAEVRILARITLPEGSREKELLFVAGGRRLNVGRGTDNDLYLNHNSVSKVHAALKMDIQHNLLVADTGSTNGTHINGSRIAYGEAVPFDEGDVVAFGDVEVRFRRINQ